MIENSRIPIVGVMGSGTSSFEERATQLGRWLATQGVHLLTGGGGGIMASVSKAFNEIPDARLLDGILKSDIAIERLLRRRYVSIFHIHNAIDILRFRSIQLKKGAPGGIILGDCEERQPSQI